MSTIIERRYGPRATVSRNEGGRAVVKAGENTAAAAASASDAQDSANLANRYANYTEGVEVPGGNPGEYSAVSWAVRAGEIANADTDVDVPFFAAGLRGSKYWSIQSATQAAAAETSADTAQTTADNIAASLPLTLNDRVIDVEGQSSYWAIAFAMMAHLQGTTISLRDRIAAVERGAVPAWMLAARVRNSGWVLEVDVADTYQGGTFDVSKLSLTVYDKGFNEAAQPCVRPCVIGITAAMRKPNPNHASKYETVSAGISTWRLSLDRQVYARAKANTGGVTVNSGFDPVLTVEEGWYVDGASTGPAQDGITVANNSTEAYPVPVARNALPPHRLLPATAICELVGNTEGATEGRTFAAVRFDLTGTTSGVNKWQVVSAMSVSDSFPMHDVASVVYRAEIDTTTFTQGEQLTERQRAYPFVGDVPADSANGTYLEGEFCNYPHVANPLGTYPKVYAVVNSATGNDATGAASTVSEATATAAPFLTELAAVKAAWALNTSAHGRNNLSGVEICFSDHTNHQLTMLKSVAGSPPTYVGAEDIPVAGTWCVYRPVTGATNCKIVRDAANTQRTVPRRTVLRDFTGLDLASTTSFGPIFLNGGEVIGGGYGQEIWVDHSPFIDVTGITSQTFSIYWGGMVFLTDMDMGATGLYIFDSLNSRHEIMLIRDCTFASVPRAPNPWCWVGVKMTRPATGVTSIALTTTANTSKILPNDGVVWAGFSLHGGMTGISHINLSPVAFDLGWGWVNVLIENYGSSQPIMAEGTLVRTKNLWCDYVTAVGQRINIGYEDNAVMADDGDGEQQLKKLMVLRRSVVRETNTKTDRYNVVDGARIHTWNVAHHVGWKYLRRLELASDNSNAPGTGLWCGEAWPATEIYIGPDARSAFENYQADHRSPAVTGTGGGDYMPAAASVLLGIIPANDEACSFDLVGNPRNGAVGALERV